MRGKMIQDSKPVLRAKVAEALALRRRIRNKLATLLVVIAGRQRPDAGGPVAWRRAVSACPDLLLVLTKAAESIEDEFSTDLGMRDAIVIVAGLVFAANKALSHHSTDHNVRVGLRAALAKAGALQ